MPGRGGQKVSEKKPCITARSVAPREASQVCQRCPAQVPPSALLFVPSGQVVLDQVAPETFTKNKVAPLRFALVRFTWLRSTNTSLASERSAPILSLIHI